LTFPVQVSRLDLFVNFEYLDLKNITFATTLGTTAEWKVNGKLSGYSQGCRGNQSIFLRIYDKRLQSMEDKEKAFRRFGSYDFYRLEYEIGREPLKNYGLNIATDITTDNIMNLWDLCVRLKPAIIDNKILGFNNISNLSKNNLTRSPKLSKYLSMLKGFIRAPAEVITGKEFETPEKCLEEFGNLTINQFIDQIKESSKNE
jgi:hypothetical protein